MFFSFLSSDHNQWSLIHFILSFIIILTCCFIFILYYYYHHYDYFNLLVQFMSSSFSSHLYVHTMIMHVYMEIVYSYNLTTLLHLKLYTEHFCIFFFFN